MYLKTEKGL